MPLIRSRELDRDTRLALWRIDESEQALRDLVQPDDRACANLSRLSRGKRTQHWLAVRALLREMLDVPGPIDCRIDEHGKPYLAARPEKISFTHSHDYAAAIVSRRGEVGIDLEKVQPNVLQIADKFMKPQELAVIGSADSLEHLSVCWCAKEAVYKLQGSKGVSLKNHMTVLPFDLQDAGTLLLDLHAAHRRERFVVHYERFLEYRLAYAMESPME